MNVLKKLKFALFQPDRNGKTLFSTGRTEDDAKKWNSSVKN